MATAEILKIDPSTGAAKADTGKLRYDLVPPDAEAEVVKVFTLGAGKYGPHNWLKGMDWSRIYAAMRRHESAFWRGERFDQVDGQHHLASVAWCALALLTYDLRGLGNDDRQILADQMPAADPVHPFTFTENDWLDNLRGGQVFLHDFSKNTYDIDEIATSLSNLCRFNGHCQKFYSVAEHSVIVSCHLPDHLKLAGLLHDATEHIIGDVRRPFKRAIKLDSFEMLLMRDVFDKLGVPWPTDEEWDLIQQVDDQVMAAEVKVLKPRTDIATWGYGDIVPVDSSHIVGFSPEDAKGAFLYRYEYLTSR